jgi:hypothetical protein
MVLWALDINSDGWPQRAHQIVQDDGVVRVTACGQRKTAGNHPRGWQEFPKGELPLAASAICCQEEKMEISERYNFVEDNDDEGDFKSHYRDINGKTFCFMAVQVGRLRVITSAEVVMDQRHVLVGNAHG